MDNDTPQTRCAEGDAQACYDLGAAAYNSARPDIVGARSWLSKGCYKHHPQSCGLMGDIVRDAKGGPADPERAAEHYQIACDGDVGSACVSLGELYMNGEGVTRDPAKAVSMFEGGCDADPQLPHGCHLLGQAYLKGAGVAADVIVADQLFRQACTAEVASACQSVGDLYAGRAKPRASAAGEPAVEDPQKVAEEFYLTACRLDATVGCMELAIMHENGTAPDASADKAARFYQMTCTIDPTRGCYQAAELMASGRVKAREGEIESLYNVACEHGHNLACLKRQQDQ